MASEVAQPQANHRANLSDDLPLEPRQSLELSRHDGVGDRETIVHVVRACTAMMLFAGRYGQASLAQQRWSVNWLRAKAELHQRKESERAVDGEEYEHVLSKNCSGTDRCQRVLGYSSRATGAVAWWRKDRRDETERMSRYVDGMLLTS